MRWPVFAFLVGSVQAAAPCEDSIAACREDCTIEFGSPIDRRPQLFKCLKRCDQSGDVCLDSADKAAARAAARKPAPKSPAPVRQSTLRPFDGGHEAQQPAPSPSSVERISVQSGRMPQPSPVAAPQQDNSKLADAGTR